MKCYISIQLRLPLRCLALELRLSFNDEDLFPPLLLPPVLFFRPLRSLRVRSFCKKNRRFIFEKNRSFHLRIFVFLGQEEYRFGNAFIEQIE